MSVTYSENRRIFKLDTENTSYLIGISPEGYVGHVYYGEYLEDADAYYLLRTEEAPFTPSVNEREKSSFLDFFPTEYPSGGIGDYRESCINVRNEAGCMGSEFFYESYEIKTGKPSLDGLPASFGGAEDTTTLEITCVDSVLNLKLILSYSAFEKEDIITRSVKIVNTGKQQVRLEKVYSACLDMDNENFELLTLHGSWARERHIQRRPICYGKQLVSSAKGESGHQEHPFIALVTPGTNQLQGRVYGMHFVYSGNFIGQAELTQFDTVRMVMGINQEEFCWNLRSGESFQAPEVVLTFSEEGLGKMTRSLHDFYRQHMIRSKYKDQKRPILINNWEATYFDFNTEKLLDIAREAKKDGIEMLVMDDGWFGKRNSDNCSLGDWFVNEEKINGGLKHLVEEVKKIGLKFAKDATESTVIIKGINCYIHSSLNFIQVGPCGREIQHVPKLFVIGDTLCFGCFFGRFCWHDFHGGGGFAWCGRIHLNMVDCCGCAYSNCQCCRACGNFYAEGHCGLAADGCALVGIARRCGSLCGLHGGMCCNLL